MRASAFFPSYLDSKWRGAKAVTRVNRHNLVWDFEKGNVKTEVMNPEPRASVYKAWQTFRFSSTNTLVRLVPYPDAEMVKRNGAFKYVEVLPPGREPIRILQNPLMARLVPSPDKKYVAVVSAPDLLLLNDAGQVIATLRVSAKEKE